MFTSPYPDVEIPNISIYESLFGTLTPEDLDRVALVAPGDGAEHACGQSRAQVDAFGGARAAHGVGVGTVLAVLCPNVPAFAAVSHRALRIGTTLTTINSLYAAAEIATQLRD